MKPLSELRKEFQPCGKIDCGGFVCRFHGLPDDEQEYIAALEAERDALKRGVIEWVAAYVYTEGKTTRVMFDSKGVDALLDLVGYK